MPCSGMVINSPEPNLACLTAQQHACTSLLSCSLSMDVPIKQHSFADCQHATDLSLEGQIWSPVEKPQQKHIAHNTEMN